MEGIFMYIRQIQKPPMKIQITFMTRHRQPPELPLSVTRLPKGQRASIPNFNVCNPKGIPIIVIISSKLDIRDDTTKFKGYEATRTGLTKDISSHFSKGNTGRTLFHDAYGSYDEFKKVCKDNNSLTKRLDQIDLKKVADQVKKIVDTLDIAIASAERGDYDKASNEALMNLANGTFELAQQVEFFAATAYRIKALTFAISETEDKIKKL
jgi:hypothetical protein